MAGLIGIVGAVVGAVAGWLALLTGQDNPQKVLSFGAGLYPWLALILPLALVGIVFFLRDDTNPGWAFINAVLGVVLATFLFALLAGLIPASMGNLDGSAILPNYFASIGWTSFGLVLLTTAVTGALGGFWADRN